MKYREAVKQSMEMLAKDSRAIFLGYNVCFGSKAYGTLETVPESKKIEMPVAENLMMSSAIGLSIEGYRPIVFFERHDFTLIALDSMVNHLDKIEKMSNGDFKTPVLIRAVIGSKKPLDPGLQHTQDFSRIFKEIFSFPVYEPKNSGEVFDIYNSLKNLEKTAMIIEKRDLYDLE